MTLFEMKARILALIEEGNPDSAFLTEDPDIAGKLNPVIDQLQFELARLKKLPRFLKLPVKAGEVLDFAALGKALGAEVYQLGAVSGVPYTLRAAGSVMVFEEDGVANIECFVYPTRITRQTADTTELSLSPDCLEILPYGVAADLLRSDPTAQYGKMYAQRYEDLLRRLDPRYNVAGIFVEGGVAL